MLMKSTVAIDYITITWNCVTARYESHFHKLLTDNSQYKVYNNIALQYNMPTLWHIQSDTVNAKVHFENTSHLNEGAQRNCCNFVPNGFYVTIIWFDLTF